MRVPPFKPLPVMVAVTELPAMPEAGKMPMAAGEHTAATSRGSATRPATNAAPSARRHAERMQATRVTGQWPR